MSPVPPFFAEYQALVNAELGRLVAGDGGLVARSMGALFGAAVAIPGFAASSIVASIATGRVALRARTLSIRAGAVVALACLVYLTLWWRTANAGFGATAPLSWPAPVWTGFALAVAVAVSLLLGHAVRVTAFASLMAGLPPADPSPRTVERTGQPLDTGDDRSAQKPRVRSLVRIRDSGSEDSWISDH
jgi:hypothetical protein